MGQGFAVVAGIMVARERTRACRGTAAEITVDDVRTLSAATADCVRLGAVLQLAYHVNRDVGGSTPLLTTTTSIHARARATHGDRARAGLTPCAERRWRWPPRA